MTISFNTIGNTRVPSVQAEFDSSRAVQGLTGSPNRMLVLGQRLATGSQPPDTLLLVSSAAQAEEYFGRGSMLAGMFVALEKAGNRQETWAMGQLADVTAVRASSSITVTAASAVTGVIHLMVAGMAVNVLVAAGSTAAAIATSINGAITARTDLPVFSTVLNAVVTVTARHAGENGNGIDIRVNYYQGQELPAGVTLAITGMAGGTVNPSLAAVRTAMAEVQYKTVVCPYNDAASLTQINLEMQERWDPPQMIEGVAYCAFSDTFVNSQAFAGGANSQHIVCMATGNSPTPTYIWAAVVASIASASLVIDPARPLQTLVLPGLLPDQPPEARFSLNERKILLNNGMATHRVDDGEQVRIERLVTRYLTGPNGAPDISYLDVTTPATLGYIRSTVVNRISQRFPRHKLADDGTKFGAGQAIVTPKIIRNELVGVFLELEAEGLVEDFDQFKTDLVVERNSADPNRLDVVFPPNLVNQLRQVAFQIQFRL